MMKNACLKQVLIGLLLGLMPLLGYAATPNTISFQGQLLDADGNPVDGTTNITFSIPGTTWTETHADVQIQEGMFGILLGRKNSLDSVDFSQMSKLQFRADGISLVVDISSVPHAFHAKTVGQTTLGSLSCGGQESAVKWTGSQWLCVDMASLKGEKGDKGEPGKDGEDGQPGLNGKDGKDGAPGTPGLNGKDGKDGAPGTPGLNGKDGKDGAPGLACWDLNGNNRPDASEDINRDGKYDAIDCKGLKGEDGKDGKDGAQGTPGQDGKNGKDGAQGVPGQDGKNGKDGAQGLACWDLNGNNRPDASEDINRDGKYDAIDCKGLKGEDGKEGVQGTPGQNGKNGKDGAQGQNGKNGAQGARGQDGKNGKDGAQGVPGQNGKDGAQGARGQDGKNGAQGARGQDGKDGKNASSGVSIDAGLAYMGRGETYIDIPHDLNRRPKIVEISMAYLCHAKWVDKDQKGGGVLMAHYLDEDKKLSSLLRDNTNQICRLQTGTNDAQDFEVTTYSYKIRIKRGRKYGNYSKPNITSISWIVQ